MNELAIIQPGQLQSAAQIRAQVNLIQQVMKAVMKPGTHYGTIPGCGDKPTLLKPGAEKLLSTFGIAVSPEVEDLSSADEARYRVRAVGSHNGITVGAGIGEASSNEEKYKWRRAVCDEEYAATDEDRKREKWVRSGGGTSTTKQVRTNIADVANTVLKMAKKRAQIDLTLTATAASDIFTQDIEDMPAEVAQEIAGQHPATAGKPPVAQPQAAPPADGKHVPADATARKKNGWISPAQESRLWAIANEGQVTTEKVHAILGAAGVEYADMLPWKQYDAVIAEIQAAKA